MVSKAEDRFSWNPYELPSRGKIQDILEESKKFSDPGDLFEGVKFEYRRGVSRAFHITQNFNMTRRPTKPNEEAEPIYNFSLTVSPAERLVLMARYDTKGSYMGRLLLNLSKNFGLLLTSQMSPHGSLFCVESNFQGIDWSGSLKYQSASSVYEMGYFQSITPNLGLGLDYVFVFSQAYNIWNFFWSISAIPNFVLFYDSESDRAESLDGIYYQAAFANGSS